MLIVKLVAKLELHDGYYVYSDVKHNLELCLTKKVIRHGIQRYNYELDTNILPRSL